MVYEVRWKDSEQWYEVLAETHEQAAESFFSCHPALEPSGLVCVRAPGSQYEALLEVTLVPKATVKVAALPTRPPTLPSRRGR